MDFQDKSELKIVPDLTSTSLSPAHFSKMSVKDAMRVISRPTSAGLRYLINNHQFSRDLLTTAWFVELVRVWFDLVSSRHPIDALIMNNMPRYVESINSLKETYQVFQSLTVEASGWKPWQTGMVMTTKAILSLKDRLLIQEDFSFFLTSRTTQDCLENVFSQTRARSPIPCAKEVKFNLRAITISQFLTEKKNSCYSFDDSDFLVDFLKKPAQVERASETQDNIEELGEDKKLKTIPN